MTHNFLIKYFFVYIADPVSSYAKQPVTSQANATTNDVLCLCHPLGKLFSSHLVFVVFGNTIYFCCPFKNPIIYVSSCICYLPDPF